MSRLFLYYSHFFVCVCILNKLNYVIGTAIVIEVKWSNFSSHRDPERQLRVDDCLHISQNLFIYE